MIHIHLYIGRMESHFIMGKVIDGIKDINKKICADMDKQADNAIAFGRGLIKSIKAGADEYGTATGKELTNTKKLLENASATIQEDADNLRKMNVLCNGRFDDELKRVGDFNDGLKGAFNLLLKREKE